MAEYKEHIIDLYKQILDFQFRSVLRFYRGLFRNFGRDLVQPTTWNAMQETITSLERLVYQDFEQINVLTSTKTLQDVNTEAQQSHENMKQLLSLAQKQVGILSENLQVQQMIAQRMFPLDEKCHQLFRLTNGNRDESYEWYKNRIEDRVNGTCNWFLQHKHFQKWSEQDSGLLIVWVWKVSLG